MGTPEKCPKSSLARYPFVDRKWTHISPKEALDTSVNLCQVMSISVYYMPKVQTNADKCRLMPISVN